MSFKDADVELKGDRATFDTLEEKGIFTGQPVRSQSDRGELLAPKLTYERTHGVLHAEGGVRALARDAGDVGLDGTPLAGGEGPVRVESTEAFWRDDPRSALFRGEVRAWRGENLLLADVLRADQGARDQTLTASGGVRTVWIPTRAEPAPRRRRTRPLRACRWRSPATRLTYRKPGDLLIYEGNVRAEQGKQALQCDRLEVQLDEDGAARTDDLYRRHAARRPHRRQLGARRSRGVRSRLPHGRGDRRAGDPEEERRSAGRGGTGGLRPRHRQGAGEGDGRGARTGAHRRIRRYEPAPPPAAGESAEGRR